jgi:nucleoside-diphosphate-sugar epimerase
MEQVRKADIDATSEILGWRPAMNIDSGLERTYDWYKDLDQ